ncbi:MAG: nitroreductase family protein [Candidatus Omnitrophica bacterium]|jgi:nitroreductase|nr:nitroreductase family protein [Candidatus Omnitrophota bacterium]
MENDILEIFKTRRCIRKFKKDPISKEVIEKIIDCARLAPTAINIQPWEFIAITSPEKKKEVADATDHGKFIADAPCCIAVFCKDTKYYIEDGAAATENILLSAKALGIGSCWVAGDKKDYTEKIRKTLNVPEGYKLVSLIPIGYPEEIPSPKKRNLSEVLHWNQW